MKINFINDIYEVLFDNYENIFDIILNISFIKSLDIY